MSVRLCTVYGSHIWCRDVSGQSSVCVWWWWSGATIFISVTATPWKWEPFLPDASTTCTYALSSQFSFVCVSSLSLSLSFSLFSLPLFLSSFFFFAAFASGSRSTSDPRLIRNWNYVCSLPVGGRRKKVRIEISLSDLMDIIRIKMHEVRSLNRYTGYGKVTMIYVSRLKRDKHRGFSI